MPSICPLNLLILNSINLGWRADSFTGKRVLVWTIRKVWFSLEKFTYQYIPLPALFLFPFPPVDSVSATALAEDSNFFLLWLLFFFLFLWILCIGARRDIDIRKKSKWKESRRKGDTIQEGMKFSSIFMIFSLCPQWTVMSSDGRAGC